MMIHRTFLSVAFFLTVCRVDVIAADWTQFRGPGGNGMVAANTAIPTNLSDAKSVWQTPLPGTGWSSPVFADGRIWVTTAVTTTADQSQLAKKKANVQFANMKTAAGSVTFKALCVDAASGKLLHDITLRKVEDPELINPLNSYASPTPAIAEGVVICHFGSYGTWCLNANTGAELWTSRLVVDHSVGPGSSPVIWKDKVLLVCDGIDQQFVAALNLNDGKTAWKTSRPPMDTDNGEFKKAYSTPLLITVSGRTQAVIPTAQWVCGYDPTSGRELWRARHGKGFSTTPMAVAADDLVIISTGFMKPTLVAIDPTGHGDVTNSHVAWRSPQGGSTMPTAVYADGILYSLADEGILSMLDAKTGNLLGRKRVGGKFASSPLHIGNHLLVMSQDGVATMFSIDGTTVAEVSKTKLDGSLMASPAVIGADLIVRSSKSLTRFSK